MEGLVKFREAFAEYSENYVVIGGAACDITMTNTVVRPRATHDIDMIVIVENMTEAFANRFWQFVREAGYRPEKRKQEAGEPPRNAYYSQFPDKNKQLIFHSDLGSQYTSNDLRELCKEFNIIQSFSKKGCPYDNACIESFHSLIKKEEIYRNTYRTFEEANMAIFKYIEGWYNRKRLHSSINYMTPDQCELLARSAA